MQVWSLGQEDLPGEENGIPLQYSCLGNPMDKEPGRLQSTGLQSWRWLATKQQQRNQTDLSSKIHSQQIYEKVFKSLVIWEMQIKTTMRYHLIPTGMTIYQKQKIISFGEDLKKKEPLSTTTDRNVNWCSHMEKNTEVPWNLKKRTTTCMHTCSVMSTWLFVNPWTVARQAPLSMGFPKAKILEWIAVSTPGNLPDPETEPMSLVSPALAGGFFTTVPPGKLNTYTTKAYHKKKKRKKEKPYESIRTNKHLEKYWLKFFSELKKKTENSYTYIWKIFSLIKKENENNNQISQELQNLRSQTIPSLARMCTDKNSHPPLVEG